jgi:hypothetical protein
MFLLFEVLHPLFIQGSSSTTTSIPTVAPSQKYFTSPNLALFLHSGKNEPIF